MFVYFQSFEPDDYRNIRFTNATRYVNKSWGTLNWSVQINVEMLKEAYSICKLCLFLQVSIWLTKSHQRNVLTVLLPVTVAIHI